MAHAGPGRGGRELEVLTGEPPTEVDGDPGAVAVAAHANDVGRDVIDVGALRAPVLEVGQPAAGRSLQVELEVPRVQRLTLEGRGEVVLAQAEVAALAAHDEGVGVLGGAGLVYGVGDLERALDHQPGRDVEEGAARP